MIGGGPLSRHPPRCRRRMPGLGDGCSLTGRTRPITAIGFSEAVGVFSGNSVPQFLLKFNSPTSIAALPLTVRFVHKGPSIADTEKRLKYGIGNSGDVTLSHIWPPMRRQLDLVYSRKWCAGTDTAYPNHG